MIGWLESDERRAVGHVFRNRFVCMIFAEAWYTISTLLWLWSSMKARGMRVVLREGNSL
jgi:hypothetical protein